MRGVPNDLPWPCLQACCKVGPHGLLLSYGPCIGLPCHRLVYSTVEFWVPLASCACLDSRGKVLLDGVNFWLGQDIQPHVRGCWRPCHNCSEGCEYADPVVIREGPGGFCRMDHTWWWGIWVYCRCAQDSCVKGAAQDSLEGIQASNKYLFLLFMPLNWVLWSCWHWL